MSAPQHTLAPSRSHARPSRLRRLFPVRKRGSAIADAIEAAQAPDPRQEGAAAPDVSPAGQCCVCGSADVSYHNYLDQPFCWPCADGDRPGPDGKRLSERDIEETDLFTGASPEPLPDRAPGAFLPSLPAPLAVPVMTESELATLARVADRLRPLDAPAGPHGPDEDDLPPSAYLRAFIATANGPVEVGEPLGRTPRFAGVTRTIAGRLIAGMYLGTNEDGYCMVDSTSAEWCEDAIDALTAMRDALVHGEVRAVVPATADGGAVVTAVTEAAVTAVSAVTRDDDSRFYPYPPTGQELDSVTWVIAATDNKPWIKKWYGSSATGWCVDNMALLARTLESEGRKAAIDLGKDEAERERGIKRDAGTYVHDVQEALIYWAASPGRTGADVAIPALPEHLEDAWYDDEPLTDVTDFMIDGFIAFVTQFGLRFEATEMHVYNQPLGIAGTLDMIVTLDGYAISYGTGPRGEDEIVASHGSVLRVCVDTKTGRTPEGTWKEQLAAYRRMTECLMPLGEIRPMPRTDCAAVLHLRPEYPDGWLLMLVSARDDEAAWERFRAAAVIYRDRQQVKGKPGTSIRPLRADGTMPGPRLCDLAGEGYGRALSPLAKALGAAAELADVARFTEADLLAVKGIGPKLIETIREMLADRGLYLAGEAPALAEVA